MCLSYRYSNTVHVNQIVEKYSSQIHHVILSFHVTHPSHRNISPPSRMKLIFDIFKIQNIQFDVRIGIWEPNFGTENQPNLRVEWLVMAFWKIENQFEAQVISQYIGHIKLAITYENTIWAIWSDFSLWAISYGPSLGWYPKSTKKIFFSTKAWFW